MKLHSAIPVLRIFSVEKAYEFYLGYLGFALDWEHRFGDDFPLYAQIHRGDVVLHLTEHHGDCTPGSAIFLSLDDIDALLEELQTRPYVYAKPGIETVDWGRQMQIADPFGNRIRFCQFA